MREKRKALSDRVEKMREKSIAAVVPFVYVQKNEKNAQLNFHELLN
jgi:hypothetical protein